MNYIQTTPSRIINALAPNLDTNATVIRDVLDIWFYPARNCVSSWIRYVVEGNIHTTLSYHHTHSYVLHASIASTLLFILFILEIYLTFYFQGSSATRFESAKATKTNSPEVIVVINYLLQTEE